MVSGRPVNGMLIVFITAFCICLAELSFFLFSFFPVFSYPASVREQGSIKSYSEVQCSHYTLRTGPKLKLKKGSCDEDSCHATVQVKTQCQVFQKIQGFSSPEAKGIVPRERE